MTVRLGLFVFEATDEIVLLLNHLLESVGEEHVDVVGLAKLGVRGRRLVPRHPVVLNHVFNRQRVRLAGEGVLLFGFHFKRKAIL